MPRPETEAYTVYLAEKLGEKLRQGSPGTSRDLNILDVCTGTGCIALQLHSQLRRSAPLSSPLVLGIDISPTAVSLARRNLKHNTQLNLLPPVPASPSSSQEQPVQFALADLFSPDLLATLQGANHSWDVMVSNPPYIPRRGFAHDTARAVRNW